MSRYFITLAYDGTNYHGWQIQPNAKSVEEELEKSLSTLLRMPIDIVGAGRTDTGVHASKMVAHFDYEGKMDTRQLTYKLNRILPQDICIFEVAKVKADAHARFDATARTYHYFVYTQKNPFRRQYAALLKQPTDFKKMNEAALLLLNVTDFTSFSKLHTDTKTNICHVTEAKWTETEPGLWKFEIKANRFLRNMVRAIVGTLLWVGQGKISIEDFRDIIHQKDRCAAGDSVAANALFLVDIEYPPTIFEENVCG